MLRRLLFLAAFLPGCVVLTGYFRPPSCGDGFLTQEDGEICDDQNNLPGDGCRADCLGVELCGDGLLDIGKENCDDGNTSSGDGCRGDCLKLEVCGDGLLDGGEGCDDGNTLPGDGCDETCQLDSCGDGVVQPPEECDDANINNTDNCIDTCRSAQCGDGFTQLNVEQCDDGNTANGDGCSSICSLENQIACGDGTLQDPEQCDDANQINTDACKNDCTLPFCGDAISSPGEQCDDGNNISGDGCEADCSLPTTAVVDLVIIDFQIERHDQDLQYFVTVQNQGTTDLTGQIKVDAFHNSQNPPPPNTEGVRRALINGLPAGASATVSILLAVAQTSFDNPGTTRNDWARVDPLNELAETNENNNTGGPQNGAVLRDFCAPCFDNSDCDLANTGNPGGECFFFPETGENFCTSAPCVNDDDCNSDSSCIDFGNFGARCIPDLNTCHANCGDGVDVTEITDDLFSPNFGGHRASLTGDTTGHPDLTHPDYSQFDDCDTTEGQGSPEELFVFHLNDFLLQGSFSASVTIDTEGTSGFGPENDTIVYLRRECMDTRSQAQLGCDDDGAFNPSFGSRLQFGNLQEGSYVIVVEGFGADDFGPFQMHINVSPN